MTRRTYAITVYERHAGGGSYQWHALVPAGVVAPLTGKSEVRLREQLGKALRAAIAKVEPEQQELLETPPGTRLHHVHLDLAMPGGVGRVGGRFPFVVEPRWFTADVQRVIAYHPFEPDRWFDADDLADVERQAPHFARAAWRGESAVALAQRKLDREDEAAKVRILKDRLLTVSFDLEAPTLLDRARAAKAAKQRAGLSRGVRQHLSQLGVDQTARAIDRTLPLGVPRAPYRGQLARLLGGPRPRSTVLVGRPGSGRSTILQRWIADRLEEDGWQLHRNADRVRRTWRLSGKRLVAGMQYFGDWEDRLLDVITEAREQRAILWLDDLHLFGRLGVTRQSERSFADFLRGPVQRGEVVVVGTATREQLARLEDDAPSFAGLLARVAIEPTGPGETAALMLAEVRRLEGEHPVTVHPFTPRTLVELAAGLFPWKATPGGPIELLRKLVASAPAAATGRAELEPDHAVALAARETGLPEHLITLDDPLDAADVEAYFGSQVIGQPEAVAAAADVVVKVRAGLADPSRPLAVYLFTGPTGTGKTELATVLAAYLYGDRRRLLRFDMSELSGPDAVTRLIGDRFAPDGLLTTRIREQPFAVVLLDEIEKAHPSVLGLLLQLFDEGRLTDAAGEVASFRHAVVIMTSNLGAKVAAPIGFGDTTEAVLGEIAKAVREFFPPELWNRIDRTVRFRPLTAEVAARVVDKELAKLIARRGLRERDVFVQTGRAVRARAVAQAFDPRFGARTVKRWLEDQVAGALADVLATAPPSRMTLARLRDDAGRIDVELETVPEAAPLSGTFPLAELRTLSAAALEPHAEAMALRLDAMLATDPVGRGLAAIRGTPRADEVRYYVEAYGDELAALRRTLAGHRKLRTPAPAPDPDPAHESHDEHDLETWRAAPRPMRTEWSRRNETPVGAVQLDRRSRDRRPRRGASQPELIAALARAELLLAHEAELVDPDAHAVTVLLSEVGAVDRVIGQGHILATTWEAHVDREAALVGGKVVERLEVDGITHRAQVIRAPFARAAFAPERGTHFFQHLTQPPSIARLEVWPGARDPVALLRAHLAALTAFDAAQEAGVAGPPNPEPLLPAVRVIAYAHDRRGVAADVEDFTTGLATRIQLPGLTHVLEALHQIRWSRR